MRPIFLFLSLIPLIACGPTENPRQSESRTLPVDSAIVVKEGLQITQAAFQTLSSNLKEALNVGGVSYALQFCNVQAMPLTDSLSSRYGVELRRASHRPRNPSNRADSLEMASIRRYLQQIQEEQELEPQVYADETGIVYHAPIRITGELCLNCHGNPGSDITRSNLQTIRQLYPEDEATGFSAGELRGIWSVRFPDSYFETLNTETGQAQ